LSGALAAPEEFSISKLEGDQIIDVVQNRKNQPGAVIVLDVATNKALALASFPNFDLNTFRQQ